MPRMLEYAVYPVVMAGAAVGIVGPVAAGVPYWRVAPIALLVAAAIVVLLERRIPWSRAWQRDHGDTGTDAAHFVGNLVVSHASLLLYAIVVGDRGQPWWPGELPFVAQLAITIAIMDLGLYAVHRASHHVRFLWRLHAIHHSAPRLYWLNGQRRHLLHEAIEGAPGFLVLGLLGAPASLVGCYLGLLGVHLMLQHGNVRYRAGALRFVFAVAELHRWHHQRLYAQTQGNYGALLSVWDYLLGTALEHRGDAPVDVGMDDEPDLPRDWAGQLVWPFRRRAPGVTTSVALLALVLVGLVAACATTLRPSGTRGELVLELGPVDLPASSSTGAHDHAAMTEEHARYRVEQAGWITSFAPSMIHGNGSAAPGRLLHHVAIGAPGLSDFLCGEHPHAMPRLMLAAGGEQTRFEIPTGFGIPVDAGQKLVAFGMFANHVGPRQEHVSFAARIGFVARANGPLKPVIPVWIDVDETCPEDGYEVPRGHHVRRREFHFPFSGTLRIAGGHMHDGGRLLRIYDQTRGVDLLRYEPRYDAEGSIAAIPIVETALTISAETRYVVEATYDNRGHGPLRGMGIVVAFVEPDHPLAR